MYFIYAYILLVIVVHMIPMGAYQLNTFEFGPLRADHLLHSLVFLPWMFLFCLKPSKRARAVKSVRSLADEPVNTKRNAGGMVEKSYMGLGTRLVWMGLGIILAVGTEGLHYWVPYRNFNPMDALFNALGVMIGAIFLVMVSAAFAKQEVGKNVQAWLVVIFNSRKR